MIKVDDLVIHAEDRSAVYRVIHLKQTTHGKVLHLAHVETGKEMYGFAGNYTKARK